MFRSIRIFILFSALIFVNKTYGQLSSFPYKESFMGGYADASPGLIFGGGNTPSEGMAVLTADPTHGIDPVSAGYLRLTSNSQYQKGFVHNNQLEIPTSNGLKIEFEYFTYGGNGADGICFFLYDASIPTFNIGGFGGSLGYAQYKSDEIVPPAHLPGVSGGYLGVGIDEFGYFARTYEGRQPFLDGTPVYAPQPGAVAIRGKGDGDALTPDNYPLLTYARTGLLPQPFNLVGPNNGRYPDSTNTGYRRAHILLERNYSSGGFNISVDIVVGGVPTKRYTLIDKFHYAEAVPERLAYGISSSTGNNTNYHEIRNLTIDVFDDKPIGLSDEAETQTNVPVDINVMDNDPSKGTGIITILDSNPSNGTFDLVSGNNGIIGYTPNPGFSGTDQFTYKLYDWDNDVESNPITVTVKVKPVGSPDNETTPVNTPVTINVKSNDDSKNGTTVVINSNPTNGTVSVNPTTNDVIYTPNANYEGPDQFTYYLETADGLVSDPITVDVTVTPSGLSPANIGLAKALIAVAKNIDGSFTLTYRFTIVNAGDITVDGLSLYDDLAAVFHDAVFSVKSIKATGSLIANTAFDGSFDKELLASGSILGPLSKEYVDVELIVSLSKTEGTYNNLAVVTGYSTGDGSVVDDESTNGLSPDPLVPGDFSPNQVTPVTLKKEDIYIPEGFSPNNDGINDSFIIENTSGKPVNLEIYNRWGNIVYKSANYQNDWTGKCTEGIHIGEDIPSGTYYYVVKIDNQKKVGFITVNR